MVGRTATKRRNKNKTFETFPSKEQDANTTIKHSGNLFLSRKLKLLKRREEMRIRPLKLQSNRMKTPRLNTLGNLFLFRKLKLFLPSEDEQRRKSERVNPLYKPTPVCSNSKMEEA